MDFKIRYDLNYATKQQQWAQPIAMIGMKTVHISCKFLCYLSVSLKLSSRFIFSCAFANTPKFSQVQKTGKGTIVNKQWILDCHEQSTLLSENDYQLAGSRKSETPSRKSTKSLKYDDDEDEVEKETPKLKSSSTIPKNDERNKMTPTKIIETFDDDEDEIPSPKMTRRSSRIKKDIQTFDDEDDDEESTNESNSSPEKSTKAQWNPQSLLA